MILDKNALLSMGKCTTEWHVLKIWKIKVVFIREKQSSQNWIRHIQQLSIIAKKGLFKTLTSIFIPNQTMSISQGEIGSLALTICNIFYNKHV